MTRLAVMADPHCDDFGTKVDPGTGLNARWVDTVGMVRWVASSAFLMNCDGLIVAGDFTEARHPAPWRVAQIGEALAAFPGPQVLVEGNHDGKRAGRSIVDVLAAGRPTWTGYSSPGVTVIGDTAIAALPYLDAHHLRAIEGYETVPEAELAAGLADAYMTIARGLHVAAASLAERSVLVVHQALAGGLMSDTQAAFLGDQGLVVDTRALGAIGFTAIVAGHFHKHQVISSDPLIVYAGSPYRTDFGEEHQPKGYLVLDIDEQGARMQFVETPARRFVTLTGAQIMEDVSEDQVEGAIVRVVDLDDGLDPAQVRTMLGNLGAFEVTEIRRRPVGPRESAGGLAETVAPGDALTSYFDGDPDQSPLVARGRGILEEVAA